MSVLHRRLPRLLREQRAQLLGSFVILLLSAAALTLMSHFALNFERLVRGFEAEAALEDASFRARSPLGDIDAIEASANVILEPVPTLEVSLSEGRTLLLLGQAERINLPVVTEGRGLEGPGELLLHPSFAAAQGLEPGDALEIEGRPFEVVGLAALPQFMYPLRAVTDLMPSPDFGVAVLPPEALAELGAPQEVVAVKFRPGDAPLRERSRALKRLLEARGVEVVSWTNVEDNARVSMVDAELRVLGLVATAMPSALLLLACVMVASVLQRLLAQETAVLGALMALGLTRREIAAHYLRIPLLLAGAAGVAGAVVGLLPVGAYLSFFVSVFAVPLDGVQLYPGRLALSVLLPALALVSVCALVLRRALSAPAAELMRGKREGAEVSRLERALPLRRLGFTRRFQLRAQLRSPWRLALTVFGAAMATVLVQWGFSFERSMDFLTRGSTDIYDFTYEYNFDPPLLEPLPEGGEPFSALLALPPGEARRDFYVMGIPPDSTHVRLHDADGAPLALDQVVVTRALARSLGIEGPGPVEVVGKLDGEAHEIEVDAIAETYAGKLLFMPLADFNARFGRPAGSCDGAFSDAPLALAPGLPHSVTSLDDKLEGARALLLTVKAFTLALVLAAFGVGVVVIYVVTALLVEETRRSVALMKVFGYDTQEIDQLVLSSSTIAVASGYLLGLPLTVLAVDALAGSLEASVGMVVPPMSIAPGYALIGFVVIMGAYAVSRRLCRRRVEAIPMREVLQGE